MKAEGDVVRGRGAGEFGEGVGVENQERGAGGGRFEEDGEDDAVVFLVGVGAGDEDRFAGIAAGFVPRFRLMVVEVELDQAVKEVAGGKLAGSVEVAVAKARSVGSEAGEFEEGVGEGFAGDGSGGSDAKAG